MSIELDIHAEAEPLTRFGPVVADIVAPLGEALPEISEVELRLGNIFEAMRERDQESNDKIVEFILSNTEWSSHARTGSEHDHFYVDTCLSQEDGGAVHIELEYELPSTDPDGDYDRELEYARIRGNMLAALPQILPTDELEVMDIAEFIKQSAEFATVTHFTSEAVGHLRDDALEGTELINLLRFNYQRKHSIGMVLCANGEYLPIEYPNPSWQDEMHTEQITSTRVSLRGEVEGEDVAWHLKSARQIAAVDVVEATTHGDEYIGLHHRLSDGESLTDEERQKLLRRMQEIQAENGFPEAHPLDWVYTVPAFLDGLKKVYNTPDETAWDEAVAGALRRELRELGLYLYEREVTTRLVAAQMIQRLQIES